MSKNIVIFADGTGQAGGLKPDQSLSNIYKLYRACRVAPDNSIDPQLQVAFYDAGLGTENDEGSIPIRPVKLFRKALSSATGTGISRNITDCYEAILKHYESGDRIFLFGFSRGAYTARCVGGVLALCGVPTKGADGEPLIRYGSSLRKIATEAVRDVYEHGSGKNKEDEKTKYAEERSEKGRRFRNTYGSNSNEGDGSNVLPYFIGVFDTVAALGSAGFFRWVLLGALVGLVLALALLIAYFLYFFFGLPMLWTGAGLAAFGIAAAATLHYQQNYKSIRDFPNPGDFSSHVVSWRLNFYNTFLNKKVRYARHAMALDENRANFPRVRWDVEGDLIRYPSGEPEWLRQVWFAGNHSDIGGSYPEDESRLSDIALSWMVEQATELPEPLLVDHSKLHVHPSAAGMQHCEVSSMRDWYWPWIPVKLRAVWSRQEREVIKDAPLHPTVLDRFALPQIARYGHLERYRPRNLSRHIQVERFYAKSAT
jgi:uncharacterized protein (DUF2235 family)